MGVSVENDGGMLRRTPGRNVLEVKAHAFTLEAERQRPRVRIAIASYHVKRPSELLEFDERFRPAHVAQMPYLVGSAQLLRQ